MTGLFDGVIPFVHTARNLSFRKAAAELSVTPAAVSKAVRRLEAELGVQLLNRTTRRVALSEEGTLFLARCEGSDGTSPLRARHGGRHAPRTEGRAERLPAVRAGPPRA